MATPVAPAPCSTEYLLFIRRLTAEKRLHIFLEKDSELNVDHDVLSPERMSDPVRPSPFDTPHRVSARSNSKAAPQERFFCLCHAAPHWPPGSVRNPASQGSFTSQKGSASQIGAWR